MAQAIPPIVGPVYPMPGYSGSGHGGASCVSSGGSDARQSGGVTWTFGGGGAAQSTSQSCNDTFTSPATQPGFDTTRFQSLYWGIDGSKLPTFTVNPADGASLVTASASGPMTFSSADSNLSQGLLVYKGAGDSTYTTTLHFTTTSNPSTPVALVDASTVGIAAASNIGGVVRVTSQLQNFNVKIEATKSGTPLATLYGTTCDCRSQWDLYAGFYYVDLPPTGDFTYSTPANHEPVTLTAGTLSDPDGTVASYSWDLNGDGAYGDQANVASPSTATLGPGDHTVGLEIVDDNGTKTDVTHTIHIDNAEPTGDFSPASTPVNHQPITLHATVSDPDQGLSAAPTYTWDLNNDNTFGDGSFDNSDASVTFGPGDHKVVLRVTDSDGKSVDVPKTIHIDNTLPTGAFSVGTPLNHTPVTFHATGPNGTGSPADPDQDPNGAAPTYSWDLNGDGTYGDSAGADVQQAFGPGLHTVGLEIVDSDGGKTHIIHQFTITDAKPTADFSCSPAVPGAGQTVTCTASDSDPDHVAGDPALIEKWDWNGNGTTNDPTDKAGHVVVGHFTVGSHKISLHVIDGDGGETVATHTLVVKDKTPPKVSISIPAQKLQTALKSGILASFASNEPATSKLTLTLSSKMGKALKLTGAIGSASPKLTRAGYVKFTVAISKTAQGKLKGLKSVDFVLAGTARDSAGNISKLSKSFTLK